MPSAQQSRDSIAERATTYSSDDVFFDDYDYYPAYYRDYIAEARNRENKKLPRVRPVGPQCQHLDIGKCVRCSHPFR